MIDKRGKPNAMVFLSVILVAGLIAGMALYATSQKSPTVTINYDPSAALDLLGQSGRLVDTPDGIIPFRLGITKEEFFSLWKTYSDLEVAEYLSQGIGELRPKTPSPDFSADSKHEVMVQVFLMRLFVKEISQDEGYELELVTNDTDGVDSIYLRSPTREYNVGKLVIDAFENGSEALATVSVEGLFSFFGTIFRAP